VRAFCLGAGRQGTKDAAARPPAGTPPPTTAHARTPAGAHRGRQRSRGRTAMLHSSSGKPVHGDGDGEGEGEGRTRHMRRGSLYHGERELRVLAGPVCQRGPLVSVDASATGPRCTCPAHANSRHFGEQLRNLSDNSVDELN
jgi:hypothetical protein